MTMRITDTDTGLDLTYIPNFWGNHGTQTYFFNLRKEIDWVQEKINISGKEINIPRLTAWYGDEGATYTYSGIEMNPAPWTANLLTLKDGVEDEAGMNFNSVLLNLYRDGQDSVAWHSDDEIELGKQPIIASFSLGATRLFKIRNKKDHNQVFDLNLEDGSLLIMKGYTQHNWEHCVPKTSKPVLPRINLTFRRIF